MLVMNTVIPGVPVRSLRCILPLFFSVVVLLRVRCVTFFVRSLARFVLLLLSFFLLVL